MKLIVLFFTLILLSCTNDAQKKLRNSSYRLYLKTGDLIFRESGKPQHLLFNQIKKNVVNDCGLIICDEENVWVWHVDQFVKKTPIDQWLRSGLNMKFSATRYIDLNGLIKEKLKLNLLRFQSLPEDRRYKWESKAVYNAEFIRKLYSKAIKDEITTLENKYIYTENEKRMLPNIVTPNQIYHSIYFKEVYNTFSPDTASQDSATVEVSVY